MKQQQRITALVLRVKGKNIALFEQTQGRVDVLFINHYIKQCSCSKDLLLRALIKIRIL